MTDRFEKRIGCLVTLAVICLFALVCYINFSGNPNFYSADMYTDMIYAQRAWETGSIFPEGWVFGNQLYAVATPNLAALLWGLTGNHRLSMALASTALTLGILFSAAWMMKPFIPSRTARMTGILTLLVVPLYRGDPISSLTGWQLMYTMCSYYACYFVTACLSFGCYLRSEQMKKTTYFALILAGFLSYGTGIGSFRQTAVMILPMLALECGKLCCRKVKKEPLLRRSTGIVLFLTVCNVLGLLTARMANVPQSEIYGSMSPSAVSDYFAHALDAFYTAASLIAHSPVLVIPVGIGIGVCMGFAIYYAFCKKECILLECLLLMLLSLCAIGAAHVLTSLIMRDIYYFLLFVLLAVLAATGMQFASRNLRGILAIGLVLFTLVIGAARVNTVRLNIQEKPRPTDVVEFLLEHDITTIYSAWHYGQPVALESDGKIQLGYWDRGIFRRIKVLCDSRIFDADPAHVAYLFTEPLPEDTQWPLTLEKAFPESGYWVYTAPENLMQLPAEVNQ